MRTIGISPKLTSDGLARTFDALGRALGVSFVARSVEDDRGIDGWIFLDADRAAILQATKTAKPAYVVIARTDLISCSVNATVRFERNEEVHSVLRGREIRADDAVGARALPHWLTGVTPIATRLDSVIWGIKWNDDTPKYFVGVSPPPLNDRECLFSHLSARRLVSLLPLVLFVRGLECDDGWIGPPLQATFMFDDPNLHWPSYGFINYEEMVREAVADNYHVSLATIPLDSWFVHEKTKQLFVRHRTRLSLLYHGNDHVSNELARPKSSPAMRKLLVRAGQRIKRMEGRTGLDVARVMAPPHGACSELALREMARVGFEAACVSRGSLLYHNPDAHWTRTIGFGPCDQIVGLPVIPRFGLSRNCYNDILIAAVLGQPIIPMTHHQALSEGYGVLAEIASFVNSLGDIAWRDMKSIARSLYSHRRDEDLLQIRMWSNRVRIAVPDGIAHVQVASSICDDGRGSSSVRENSKGSTWSPIPTEGLIPVRPGDVIEIASGATEHPCVGTKRHRLRLVPAVRRLLTEGRDRMLPSVRRVVDSTRSIRFS
jgi:hypothetical protein